MHQQHRSKWFPGPFGWILANAHRQPFKPCKGQLKFFTPKITGYMHFTIDRMRLVKMIETVHRARD